MTKFDKLFNYIKKKQSMADCEADGSGSSWHNAYAQAWDEVLAYAKKCNKKKKMVVKEDGRSCQKCGKPLRRVPENYRGGDPKCLHCGYKSLEK